MKSTRKGKPAPAIPNAVNEKSQSAPSELIQGR
jgi:hypothetical protein